MTRDEPRPEDDAPRAPLPHDDLRERATLPGPVRGSSPLVHAMSAIVAGVAACSGGGTDVMECAQPRVWYGASDAEVHWGCAPPTRAWEVLPPGFLDPLDTGWVLVGDEVDWDVAWPSPRGASDGPGDADPFDAAPTGLTGDTAYPVTGDTGWIVPVRSPRRDPDDTGAVDGPGPAVPTGLTGLTGDTGYLGLTGDTGATGDTGIGEAALPGPVGPTGDTADTGEAPPEAARVIDDPTDLVVPDGGPKYEDPRDLVVPENR